MIKKIHFFVRPKSKKSDKKPPAKKRFSLSKNAITGFYMIKLRIEVAKLRPKHRKCFFSLFLLFIFFYLKKNIKLKYNLYRKMSRR